MAFFETFGMQDMPIIHQILVGIGLASVLPLAWRLVQFFWLYFVRPSGLSKYALPDAYAMVTGASDGIGRAMALELAARGFNLVLHGRNAAKLEKVRDAVVASRPKCRVRIAIADASNSHGMKREIAAIVEDLRHNLDGPLTVLINNCGGTGAQTGDFTPFPDLNAAEIDAMLNLNARFHVQMTHALWPLLAEEKQEKKKESSSNGSGNRPALLMYTGSLGGTVPAPWLSLYAPAKEFGNAWMVSLGRELIETHPHVETLNVLVGKVTDVQHSQTPETLTEPGSATMARAMLDRVGCGRLSVVGHWAHAILAFVMTSGSEAMQTALIGAAMKLEMANKQQAAAAAAAAAAAKKQGAKEL